jgi:hypothetical protein
MSLSRCLLRPVAYYDCPGTNGNIFCATAVLVRVRNLHATCALHPPEVFVNPEGLKEICTFQASKIYRLMYSCHRRNRELVVCMKIPFFAMHSSCEFAWSSIRLISEFHSVGTGSRLFETHASGIVDPGDGTLTVSRDKTRRELAVA